MFIYIYTIFVQNSNFFVSSWNLKNLFHIYLSIIWSFYRRGDPDKTDYFGNTCLHLAAARGHELCVKFLVKFGCNIWSLDIDRHSARELAAINGWEKILQFLDIAQADQELNNRKKSRLLREKAEKDAEKRYSYRMWIYVSLFVYLPLEKRKWEKIISLLPTNRSIKLISMNTNNFRNFNLFYSLWLTYCYIADLC